MANGRRARLRRSIKYQKKSHDTKVSIKVEFLCQALPRKLGPCQTLPRVVCPAVQSAPPFSFAFIYVCVQEAIGVHMQPGKHRKNQLRRGRLPCLLLDVFTAGTPPLCFSLECLEELRKQITLFKAKLKGGANWTDRAPAPCQALAWRAAIKSSLARLATTTYDYVMAKSQLHIVAMQ